MINKILTTDGSRIEMCKDGIALVELTSVKKFAKYAVDNFKDINNLIFRGQEDDNWEITSSFQRQFNNPYQKISENILKEHLRNFKKVARGIVRKNSSELSENEWWVLGQHYGLATPLTDWTKSYWVALFFAFSNIKSTVEYRTIYALDIIKLFQKTQIEIIDPEINYNNRLINQSGVLLKNPLNKSFEDYIRKIFKGEDEIVLQKIKIKNSFNDSLYCNNDLNKMNINNRTLFPDLEGVCKHANMGLKIPELISTLPNNVYKK